MDIFEWSTTDGWEYMLKDGKTYRRPIGSLYDYKLVE